MRRISIDNVCNALLSLLIPGFGQLAQERNAIGLFQLAWAAVAGVSLFAAESVGIPRPLAVIELALVTGWSVVDAVLYHAPDSHPV
jgi:hypothetical protein